MLEKLFIRVVATAFAGALLCGLVLIIALTCFAIGAMFR